MAVLTNFDMISAKLLLYVQRIPI